MSQGQGGPWKGHGRSEGEDASLKKAFEAAWENAKKNGGPAGKYVMKSIEIETTNPIHAYSVDIESTGG